jgi:hypothetical protein
MMFHVSFGSGKREAEIRKIATLDRTTAVILAAVHFEWMLKRAILKMGSSPTKDLRGQLEGVYRMEKKGNQDGYKEVWHKEVGSRVKNASLQTVIGHLSRIQSHALNVRGKVVHGNGTVSVAHADEAIDLFLGAGKKLRDFASKRDIDLDTRLKTRPKSKVVNP